MNLWIRSQDGKKISKINEDLIVVGNTIRKLYNDETSFMDLATYAKEERALEILNEIQKYIEKQGTNEILINDNGIPNGSIYYGKVYEMPKE